MTISEKGFELTKQEKRVTISQSGIEIHHKGMSLSGEMAGVGFVYLVIDCSGSMEGSKIGQAKNGALKFAKQAKTKGYAVGLMQFHSRATHLCEPTQDITLLKRRLETIEIGDATYMAEAIELVRKKLKDRKGALVMLVATDGMPNGPGDPEASLEAGERAKREGIDVITIGTDDADQKFLRELASRSDLGVKVPKVQFEQAITSAVKKLPMLPGKSE
jgi:Mg-chelatase subunit ChlD